MAKYDVTFSCGHTETVALYGPDVKRHRMIDFYEREGECSECAKARINEFNSRGCEEKRMLYREYKKSYPHCATKRDSYDDISKTVVVYVPIETPLTRAIDEILSLRGVKRDDILYERRVEQAKEILEKDYTEEELAEMEKINAAGVEIIRNYKANK